MRKARLTSTSVIKIRKTGHGFSQEGRPYTCTSTISTFTDSIKTLESTYIEVEYFRAGYIHVLISYRHIIRYSNSSLTGAKMIMRAHNRKDEEITLWARTLHQYRTLTSCKFKIRTCSK